MLPYLGRNMNEMDATNVLMYNYPHLYQGEEIDPDTGMPLPPAFSPYSSMNDYIGGRAGQLAKETIDNSRSMLGYGILAKGMGSLLQRNPSQGSSSLVFGAPTRILDSATSFALRGNFSGVSGSMRNASAWRRYKPLSGLANTLIPRGTGLKSWLAWSALTGNPDRLSEMTLPEVVGSALPYVATAGVVNTARAFAHRHYASFMGGFLVKADTNPIVQKLQERFGKGITDLSPKSLTKFPGATTMANQEVAAAVGRNIEKYYSTNMNRILNPRMERMLTDTRRIMEGKSALHLNTDKLMKFRGQNISANQAALYLEKEIVSLKGSMSSMRLEDAAQKLDDLERQFTNIKKTSISRMRGTKAFAKEAWDKGLFHPERNKFLQPPTTTSGIGPTSTAVKSGLTEKMFGYLGKAAATGAAIGTGITAASYMLDIAAGVQRFRSDVARELARGGSEYETAFTMTPMIYGAGTERQRAVEAIQSSSLNLRNFVGNEAGLMHR